MLLSSFGPNQKKILIVLYASVSIAGLAALSLVRDLNPQIVQSVFHFKQLAIFPLLIIITGILLRPSALFGSSLAKKLAEKQARIIDSVPGPRLGLWILLAAGLSLFAELMIIRLHSSYFPLFAFFKNVSLLSCFLGLGIGYARARRPLITIFTLPLFALQIAFIDAVSTTPIRLLLLNPIPERFTMGLAGVDTVGHAIFVYFFLSLIFAFNALCFVPLGQLVSRLMLRKEKLTSYSWNLVGSLLGILSFSFISFVWAPPSVWIMVVAILLVFFFQKDRVSVSITFLSLMVILLFFSTPVRLNRLDLYSPYQILTLIFEPDFTSLAANKTYFQRMLDLREKNVEGNEFLQEWADYYNFPYILKPSPEDVLVVGSGAGNDVASALRNKAKNIDAVEIDPAILAIGKELHPESPYGAENVTPIVADARAFIRQTDKKYDLIVYGVLDSHTLLSGKSSVRLDSFVYTVEAFREARGRLKQNGLINLTFAGNSLGLGRKLYLMLEDAFDGQPPAVYKTKGLTFIAGEELDGYSLSIPERFTNITDSLADERIGADKSTDDWPFLYMPVRKYPASTLVVIGLLLIISIVFIFRFVPGSLGGFSVPSFFLGAGFMLVETKGITELALFYGSTWLVISIVIAAILVLAFLANLTVIKIKKPPLVLIYTFLFASVILGFSLSSAQPAGFSSLVIKIIMTGALTLPLFFSGLAFSSEIKRSAHVGQAISSNLLGAMLGGFLEYNSMYFGFQFLYVLALLVYVLALFASIRLK